MGGSQAQDEGPILTHRPPASFGLSFLIPATWSKFSSAQMLV